MCLCQVIYWVYNSVQCYMIYFSFICYKFQYVCSNEKRISCKWWRSVLWLAITYDVIAASYLRHRFSVLWQFFIPSTWDVCRSLVRITILQIYWNKQTLVIWKYLFNCWHLLRITISLTYSNIYYWIMNN